MKIESVEAMEVFGDIDKSNFMGKGEAWRSGFMWEWEEGKGK